MSEHASSEPWPEGILTLVFTDVERSTELWQLDEDAFGWALMEHDHEVRDALQRFAGREVKHTGDGFFLVFTELRAAVEFALDLQTRLTQHDWPAELGSVRTRIGLHVGQPRLYGDDYRGAVVNLAARVCEVSWGGQILATAEVVAGLAEDPELAARSRDLGAHTLHGIEQPVRLYEVQCEATSRLSFGPVGGRPEPAAADAGGQDSMPPDASFTAEDAAAWNSARAALKTADHETAVTALLRLSERHPEDARVFATLGIAFAWGSQYERAEQCLKRSLALDDRRAATWFNLARVYGKMGRRDEIAEALTMALKADPSHAKARSVAAKYGVQLPTDTNP